MSETAQHLTEAEMHGDGNIENQEANDQKTQEAIQKLKQMEEELSWVNNGSEYFGSKAEKEKILGIKKNAEELLASYEGDQEAIREASKGFRDELYGLMDTKFEGSSQRYFNRIRYEDKKNGEARVKDMLRVFGHNPDDANFSYEDTMKDENLGIKTIKAQYVANAMNPDKEIKVDGIIGKEFESVALELQKLQLPTPADLDKAYDALVRNEGNEEELQKIRAAITEGTIETYLAENASQDGSITSAAEIIAGQAGGEAEVANEATSETTGDVLPELDDRALEGVKAILRHGSPSVALENPLADFGLEGFEGYDIGVTNQTLSGENTVTFEDPEGNIFYYDAESDSFVANQRVAYRTAKNTEEPGLTELSQMGTRSLIEEHVAYHGLPEGIELVDDFRYSHLLDDPDTVVFQRTNDDETIDYWYEDRGWVSSENYLNEGNISWAEQRLPEDLKNHLGATENIVNLYFDHVKGTTSPSESSLALAGAYDIEATDAESAILKGYLEYELDRITDDDSPEWKRLIVDDALQELNDDEVSYVSYILTRLGEYEKLDNDVQQHGLSAVVNYAQRSNTGDEVYATYDANFIRGALTNIWENSDQAWEKMAVDEYLNTMNEDGYVIWEDWANVEKELGKIQSGPGAYVQEFLEANGDRGDFDIADDWSSTLIKNMPLGEIEVDLFQDSNWTDEFGDSIYRYALQQHLRDHPEDAGTKLADFTETQQQRTQQLASADGEGWLDR